MNSVLLLKSKSAISINQFHPLLPHPDQEILFKSTVDLPHNIGVGPRYNGLGSIVLENRKRYPSTGPIIFPKEMIWAPSFSNGGGGYMTGSTALTNRYAGINPKPVPERIVKQVPNEKQLKIDY